MPVPPVYHQLSLFSCAPPDQKRCCTCHAVKPLTDFHNHRGYPDGKSKQCKICVNTAQAAALARPGRKDSVNARLRAARIAQGDEHRARARAYYAANKEHIRAYRQGYYARLQRAAPSDGEKTCKSCGAVKSFAAFPRSPSTRDGRGARCARCMADAAVARYQRDADKARARRMDYYHRNAPREQERHRHWVARNKEALSAYSRLYRAAHAEEIRAAWSRWYRENQERLRRRAAIYRRTHLREHCERQKVRQARQRANGGTFTRQDLTILYALQEGRCAYCHTLLPPDFHLEHKIPVSRGGSSDPDNICLACPPCNLRKGTLTDEEFRARYAIGEPTSAASK